MLPFLTMEEQQGNEQCQQPGRRGRGLRLRGGGRGRGARLRGGGKGREVKLRVGGRGRERGGRLRGGRRGVRLCGGRVRRQDRGRHRRGQGELLVLFCLGGIYLY